MSTELTQPIDNILRKVPGVIGVVLADADGQPLYANGRFDSPLKKFIALCTVAHEGCVAIGKPFNETLASIIVEYNKMKIYHVSIAEKGQLIILVKTQESQFGMLKIEIQNAIETFQKMFSAEKSV